MMSQWIRNCCTVVSSIALASYSISAMAVCPFPQHFKIAGPKGTRLVRLETVYPSDLIVTPTINETFSVEDNTNCKGGSRREVRIVVASDSKHWADVTFFDGLNGHGKVISLSQFNGFKLKSIDKVADDSFTMSFIQE